jgi:ATP-dependent DNA helicase PIF1
MTILTEDQLVAVRAVQENRCVFITGPAGTGKSVLIRHLVSDVFPGETIHLCSSTGISAYNIKGMTVHSFIARISLRAEHPLAVHLSRNDIIIIDEISMLGKTVFEELSDSIQRVHKVSGIPFAGHRIIFVGDFAQLPPVDDSFCFQSKYWCYINKVVELSEIKRQSHLPFVEFLLRIRKGELTTDDRKRLIELSKKEIPIDSIHLYPTNERARLHNEMKLRRESEESKHEISSYRAVVMHHKTDERDAETFFKSHKSRIYEHLETCVGARVMLTCNLDVENGWMNGTIGNVVNMTKDTIWMSREGDGTLAEIRREVYARQKVTRCSKCRLENCDKHQMTTLYLDVMPEEVDRDLPHIIVHQFPLMLAWGMTIHKSQGLTLPGCVIHLYGRYTPSLFYVAISRCVSEEGVVIRSGDGVHFEQIIPEEMVMREMFHKKEKECQVCQEVFVGPYKLCQDCCSCPSPYEVLPFTAFSKKLTKEKEEYVYQVLEQPMGDMRYKKFRKYLESLYKVFKQ